MSPPRAHLVDVLTHNTANSNSPSLAQDSRISRRENGCNWVISILVREALALDPGDGSGISKWRDAQLAELAGRESVVAETDLDFAEDDLDCMRIQVGRCEGGGLYEHVDGWLGTGFENACW